MKIRLRLLLSWVAFSGLLSLQTGLFANGLAAAGPAAVITPDPETQTLVLSSSFEGVELRVLDPETGENLNTPDGLYQHGWRITPEGYLRSRMDGFYETIPLFNQAGQPLRVQVSGLYPGVQEVTLHYFSEPFAFGSTWNTSLHARVNDERWKAFDSAKGELIRGIGGHDQSSLYRGSVAVAGSESQPASRVSLEIRKAKWSKQATVREIRIDTRIDPDAPLTGMERPEQSRVRERLEELGAAVVPGGEFFAAALPSTTKVKPKTFAAIDPAHLDKAVELASGRNAYANFQILVYSPDTDIEDLGWEVEPFAQGNGTTVNFEPMVAPVGFVFQPRNPRQISSFGYLPDPLLNFMDALDVKRGDAQTIWVRLRVPAGAEPGVYESVVHLKRGGETVARIPVSLEVWDFEHPKWPLLPVVTGTGKHRDFEMEYGINPAPIYRGAGSHNIFDERYEGDAVAKLREWKERGVNALNLRYFTSRHGPMPTDEEVEEVADTIESYYRVAEEAGVEDIVYMYLYDEAKPADYPAMAKVTQAIKDRVPDLRLLTTAFWGRDQSFGLDAGVEIDTWTPIVQHFRNSDLAEIGREKGRDIWWYTCNYPFPPMPNMYLHSKGMESRMLMGVMPHAFQVDGFLYYATTSWRGKKPITSGPYTDWTPQRPFSHGGWYQMGPDREPIPSMRLEIFRDGLEDYNLIAMAIQKQKALEEAGLSVDSETAELLSQLQDVPNPYVTSVLEYLRDPIALDKLRARLATFVVEASAELN